MKNNLENLFFKNGEQILDLSDWEIYHLKKDLEKKVFVKYFKKDVDGIPLTVGVYFFDEDFNNIKYIAWGKRGVKDCSYNSLVKDNKYLVKVLAGCPIFDIENVSFFKKYFPILFFLTLTFMLSILISCVYSISFMNLFMGIFLLTIGLLKFYDLKSFQEMVVKYDILADKLKIYKILYPFLEVLFGIYFLAGFGYWASFLVIIIYSVQTIGIVKILKNNEYFTCACLGGLYNVPLSWITVFENMLMVMMSLYMVLR